MIDTDDARALFSALVGLTSLTPYEGAKLAAHIIALDDDVIQSAIDGLGRGSPGYLLARNARVKELETRIANAVHHANNRWDEWSSRAEEVHAILEGRDPYADQSGEGGV